MAFFQGFCSGYKAPSDISHSVYTTSLNPLLKMYKARTYKRHLNKISESLQLARDEIGEFTRKKRNQKDVHVQEAFSLIAVSGSTQ